MKKSDLERAAQKIEPDGHMKARLEAGLEENTRARFSWGRFFGLAAAGCMLLAVLAVPMLMMTSGKNLGQLAAEGAQPGSEAFGEDILVSAHGNRCRLGLEPYSVVLTSPWEDVCVSMPAAPEGVMSSTAPEDVKPPAFHSGDGFVTADLDEIWRNIDIESDVMSWNIDPDEYLPMIPPFLKMDADALYHILDMVKKYDWEPHAPVGHSMHVRAREITVVCRDTAGQNRVVTYLKFAKDADGRCYAFSDYDDQIAYLSDEDYGEVLELFEAAPEWPEKYFERFGYRHYSEYKEQPDELPSVSDDPDPSTEPDYADWDGTNQTQTSQDSADENDKPTSNFPWCGVVG